MSNSKNDDMEQGPPPRFHPYLYPSVNVLKSKANRTAKALGKAAPIPGAGEFQLRKLQLLWDDDIPRRSGAFEDYNGGYGKQCKEVRNGTTYYKVRCGPRLCGNLECPHEWVEISGWNLPGWKHGVGWRPSVTKSEVDHPNPLDRDYWGPENEFMLFLYDPNQQKMIWNEWKYGRRPDLQEEDVNKVEEHVKDQNTS